MPLRVIPRSYFNHHAISSDETFRQSRQSESSLPDGPFHGRNTACRLSTQGLGATIENYRTIASDRRAAKQIVDRARLLISAALGRSGLADDLEIFASLVKIVRSLWWLKDASCCLVAFLVLCLHERVSDPAHLRKWKRKKPSRSCFIEWSSGDESLAALSEFASHDIDSAWNVPFPHSVLNIAFFFTFFFLEVKVIGISRRQRTDCKTTSYFFHPFLKVPHR